MLNLLDRLVFKFFLKLSKEIEFFTLSDRLFQSFGATKEKAVFKLSLQEIDSLNATFLLSLKLWFCWVFHMSVAGCILELDN